MPLASHTPATISNRTTRLLVVKPGPGRKRRSLSWLRRSISSISGGRMPPPGVGPRFHGPFGPPEPLPFDELFQGILSRPLPWFPKVRRLYGQRRRGANLAALQRDGVTAYLFKAVKPTRYEFRHGSCDARRCS